MTTRAIGLLSAAMAILLAAAVVVGINIGKNGAQSAPAEPQSPSAAAPATRTPEPSYNPDAGDASDENDQAPPETQEAAWAPAVDNFARNFTYTTGGAKKWRQRLIGNPKQPFVTTEVAEQLATVDIRNVPEGHYDSREIVTSSEYDFAVKVTYREGWAMVLYLITDGSRYQVYAYDKWEG